MVRCVSLSAFLWSGSAPVCVLTRSLHSPRDAYSQDGYVDWTRVKPADIRLPPDFDPDEGCVFAGKVWSLRRRSQRDEKLTEASARVILQRERE